MREHFLRGGREEDETAASEAETAAAAAAVLHVEDEAAADWEWDQKSALVKSKTFKLGRGPKKQQKQQKLQQQQQQQKQQGHGRLVVATISRARRWPAESEQCRLVVRPSMRKQSVASGASNIHTISMRFDQGFNDGGSFMAGLVKSSAPAEGEGCFVDEDTSDAWMMTSGGLLYGNGFEDKVRYGTHCAYGRQLVY